MIVAIIIVTISIVLDGLLSNYIPFMFHSLSYFTPLLTLTSLFFISPLLKTQKQYFIFLIIIGFIYDICYTNLLIFHASCFLLLGYMISKYYQMFKVHFFTTLLTLVLLIILYDSLQALFIVCFGYFSFSFFDYCNVLIHSMLLNIGYGTILYLLLYKRIKKKNQITLIS